MLLKTFRPWLLLGFATAIVLAFVLAAPASAQFEDLEEQCPPEFPLCPEGEEEPEEEEDPFADPPEEGDPFAPEDDPQVTETPEGGVAAGTGAPLTGSMVPLLLLGAAVTSAAVGGLVARRQAARL